MKKIVYLTENDLYRITNRVLNENIIEEGIFDGITNMFQGLKGVWRGEGYDFFWYLNSLKNMTKELKKLDQPNLKIMDKLTELKNKISVSKMPPEKKEQLIFEIDAALENFKEYSEHIDKLERVADERLKGTGTYVNKPKTGLTTPTSSDSTTP
jgi:DNA-binding protein H-NS